MAITMINQKELIEDSFLESHCWAKLKSLIFCAVEWTGENATSSKLLAVTSMDFVESERLFNEIEEDYEYIRQKLINQGYEALTGADGQWIQARTKGTGHGSKTRAFYARTKLVAAIFDSAASVNFVNLDHIVD